MKVEKEFRMVRHLECFLKRLGVKQNTIIDLDWSNHEEWQWSEYKKRIEAAENKNVEEIKTDKTTQRS